MMSKSAQKELVEKAVANHLAKIYMQKNVVTQLGDDTETPNEYRFVVYAAGGGGAASEWGTVFRTDGRTILFPSRSNALESEDRSPASDAGSGGDSSNESPPFHAEMQQDIERGYNASIRRRDVDSPV